MTIIIILSVLMLLIFILILIVSVVKRNTSSLPDTRNTLSSVNDNKRIKDENIPEIIWTYEKDRPTHITDLVYKSWRQNNPEYKINILRDNNIGKYIDLNYYNFKSISRDNKIRLIKYILLNTYGGVWIDSNIICLKPASMIFPIKNVEIGAFYNTSSKIMEEFFLICSENSTYIQKLMKYVIKNPDKHIIVKKNTKRYFKEYLYISTPYLVSPSSFGYKSNNLCIQINNMNTPIEKNSFLNNLENELQDIHNKNGNNKSISHTRFEDLKKSGSKLKILVIQNGAYDVLPEFVKYSTEINKRYCDKYGYRYKYIEHDVNEMPPYWLKVRDIYDELNDIDNKSYDYIMYVDLDAIFYDFSYSIEDVLYSLNSTHDILIGRDIHEKNDANTGVFLCKNSEFSRTFCKVWLSSCLTDDNKLVNNCKKWKRNENTNKWVCNKCEWAGKSYEQGVFNEILHLYKDNILILNNSLFSNRFINKKSYILHLMVSSTEYRNIELKKIRDKIMKD